MNCPPSWAAPRSSGRPCGNGWRRRTDDRRAGVPAGGPAVGNRVLLIRPDGHEATGREVEARTTGLALALHQHGMAGQRIGLWSWNSAAAIEAHLATEWIGATRVPVDPGAPPAEAAAVFKAAGVGRRRRRRRP